MLPAILLSESREWAVSGLEVQCTYVNMLMINAHIHYFEVTIFIKLRIDLSAKTRLLLQSRSSSELAEEFSDFFNNRTSIPTQKPEPDETTPFPDRSLHTQHQTRSKSSSPNLPTNRAASIRCPHGILKNSPDRLLTSV